MKHTKDKTLGLTAAKLCKILRYDKATGIFYWLKTGSGRKVTAGTRHSKGVRIELPGYGRFGFLAHRLAWLYVTGEWPKDQIDHKDNDCWNNRWGNLREATNSQNQVNRGVRPHNKSGMTGVAYHSSQGKWYAECSINGVRVLHSYFKTRREAVAARQSAVKQFHGDYAVEQ